MKRDRRALLWDMQQARFAIGSFIAEATAQRYATDLLLRSAVERQLQNVGEALSQLSQAGCCTGGTRARQSQLISSRNVLVHGCVCDDDESGET